MGVYEELQARGLIAQVTNEEEIRKMRLEEFVSDADFKIGDTVSIEDGPLKGFLGTVKELNDSAQKAKISTSMFGRNTDVEVEYIQIKKVDAPLPEPSDDSAE